MAYLQPQLKIFQDFANIPTAVTRNLNAFIVGPNYHLFRYAQADEKAVIGIGAYAGAAIDNEPWPGLPSGSEVDQTYVKVFADDAMLLYKSGIAGTLKAESGMVKRAVATGLVLRSGNGSVVDDAELPASGVRTGDYASITKSGDTVIRRITGVEALIGDATVAADWTSVTGDLDADLEAPTGTFTGTRATTFVAEVISGAADFTDGSKIRVRVRSTADGKFIDNADIDKDNPEIGTLHGLTFLVNDEALAFVSGAKASLAAAPGVAGDFSILVFNQALPVGWADSDAVTITLSAMYSGIELPKISEVNPGSWNWLTTESDISVEADIEINHPALVNADGDAIDCLVTSANLFVQYRALRSDNSDEIQEVSALSDIEAVLGKAHPDNPLAYGVWLARLNSGSRPVKFLALGSLDQGGWTAALDLAARASDVYGVTPISTSASVQDLVKAHVGSVSTEDSQRWRIAFLGMGDQIRVDVYTAATNPDGIAYTATVGTPTTRAVFDQDVLAESEVAVGDEVRFNFLDDAVTGITGYSTGRVVAVLDDKTIEIDKVFVTGAIEVYHNQTAAQQTATVRGRSLSYRSRRVYNCFAGRAVTTHGYTVYGDMVAAAVAGLCSSAAPQQPITNVELAGFSNLPDMYRTFTPSQLNSMAEAGTLLVAQDYRGGPVYVRHQVSTAAIDGNLNTTELSLVKNLDSISYLFSDRFRSFRGNVNVTPETLARVEVLAKDTLDFLMSSTDTGDIGPQLLGDETRINGVYQDASLKDTVYMDIDLELPKPFNHLNITLRAV